MVKSTAEWLWRLSILIALLWLGFEIRSLHADLMSPVDEPVTAEATDPGELQSRLDEIRDALADLNRKVEAVMLATSRTK